MFVSTIFCYFANISLIIMHKRKSKYSRLSLVTLLFLVTSIWVIAPIVHTYVDHTEHHQAVHHNKQVCITCMELSMPYMPGTPLTIEILILSVVFVVSTTFISHPYTAPRRVRSLRAPPVW